MKRLLGLISLLTTPALAQAPTAIPSTDSARTTPAARSVVEILHSGLGRTLRAYWSNFARTGDLNGAGLTACNPLTADGNGVQELRAEGAGFSHCQVMNRSSPRVERFGRFSRTRGTVAGSSLQRHQIEQAAHRFDVEPGLVAAILADEVRRRDLWDSGQDGLARLLLDLPAPLSAALQWGAEFLTGRSLDDQSFGASQMKPATLRELAQAGVLPIPADLRLQLALLLRYEYAPLLIAARIRQTIDHWAAGGVDVSQSPDILATLYSIGLSTGRGVHRTPQPNARGREIAQAARSFT